jgi:hypothetical protein
MAKAKKTKRVSYELIPRESVIGQTMYRLLDQLVAEHHDEVSTARIALAWCTSWKPDVDGRVVLGKCKKASDLDRELAAYDFIILLSRAFWLDDRIQDAQRIALLDHELCHAAVKLDDNGHPMEDEKGRTVYRMRKHSIEEFTEIVQRHGCYKGDLEGFAAALWRSGLPQYTPCEKCVGDMPGWLMVETAGGTKRAARCSCFTDWSDRCAAIREMRVVSGVRMD